MTALRRGFNAIVPPDFLQMFDEREVELIIGGLCAIDVADWKNNTEYRHCKDHPQLVGSLDHCPNPDTL